MPPQFCRSLAPHAPPTAILHPNGAVLILPDYDPEFVQRLKRLIPPHTRVFHGVQRAYVIISPWDKKAVALAGEWFANLVRHVTTTPYDFRADDALLVVQQQTRRAGRRAA